MTNDTKFYMQQPDGTLKPVEAPKLLIERLAFYLMLREKGLELSEIRFLWNEAMSWS